MGNSVSALLTWNTLPIHIRCTNKLATFECQIHVKHFVFLSAYVSVDCGGSQKSLTVMGPTLAFVVLIAALASAMQPVATACFSAQ